MTTRAEDLAEEVLELHKQLAVKVQTMHDEVHKLCGQVSELRQLALAMVAAMGDMRERLANTTIRMMLIAASVSLGGGIIAAVITARVWLASRLDSVFGVRP